MTDDNKCKHVEIERHLLKITFGHGDSIMVNMANLRELCMYLEEKYSDRRWVKIEYLRGCDV